MSSSESADHSCDRVKRKSRADDRAYGTSFVPVDRRLGLRRGLLHPAAWLGTPLSDLPRRVLLPRLRRSPGLGLRRPPSAFDLHSRRLALRVWGFPAVSSRSAVAGRRNDGASDERARRRSWGRAVFAHAGGAGGTGGSDGVRHHELLLDERLRPCVLARGHRAPGTPLSCGTRGAAPTLAAARRRSWPWPAQQAQCGRAGRGHCGGAGAHTSALRPPNAIALACRRPRVRSRRPVRSLAAPERLADGRVHEQRCAFQECDTRPGRLSARASRRTSGP